MRNVKNRTSSVPVNRSISKIEDLLVEFGATNISKDYEAGKPSGIFFTVWQDNIPLNFKLPAKISQVRDNFIKKAGKKRLTTAQLEQICSQAERTAWRILQELIQIRLSYIAIESAEMFEMFLADIVNTSGVTYYQLHKNQGFKQLKVQND